MKKKEILYLNLILFHVGIGFLVYLIPFISKIYGLAIFVIGIYYVINKQNKNSLIMGFSHKFVELDITYNKQIEGGVLKIDLIYLLIV